ncbi:MAG: hypothetical protein BWY78_00183 [Alphaproteobacteria bacterium ADurb.Bin438]|nr:MAG: hypothetical protein BWY78_00183 [Alphaproteobacteria bacterium ADurb.Bin438]
MSFNKYDFSKNCYFKELERKNEIISSLSIPLGVITLIGGFFAHIIVNYNFNKNCHLDTIFVILNIILFMVLAYSLYCLLKSANGQPYKYILPANEIQNYYNELDNYYKNEGGENMTLNDISSFLEEAYVEASSNNWHCNFQKSAYRYKSHISIIIALIMFGLSSMVYIYVHQKYKSENESIFWEISNMTKDNCNNKNESNNQSSVSNPQTPKQPPKAVTPKPVPPQKTIIINEGTTPQKK